MTTSTIGSAKTKSKATNQGNRLASQTSTAERDRQPLPSKPEQLTRLALARLSEEDGDPDPDAREAEADTALEEKEKRSPFTINAWTRLLKTIKQLGARRVLDSAAAKASSFAAC